MFAWSDLYRCRQQVKRRYPNIWVVPVLKKETDRLFPLASNSRRVLEIGAGDRRFGKKLQRYYPMLDYRSYDIDRQTVQDYYRLEDITGDFDLVYAFELIEHLSVEDGLELLRRVHGFLRTGGKILIGTPNLYHPHRYWGDVTHKTPYKYEELGGLLLMAGFSIPTVYRLYNAPWLQRWFRLYIGVWLHRYLDIDFAPTILVEAEKIHITND